MYLTKLYSEPKGLFQEVEFKNGVNFIYGKKEFGEPKDSINSIGKSTFLDLLDFCLLASYQKSSNPRLFSASGITDEFKIVLEFKIGDKPFIIKRSTKNPREVEFGPTHEPFLYPIERVKEALCNLVFKRDEYPGHFSSKWFRSLMNFYLKIQKFKKAEFLDPIKYIGELSETELNVYHLYLLGLNNSIAYENLNKRTDLKRLKPAIKEIDRLLKEKYDLSNISETNSNINKLKIEIKKLDKAIDTFKLGEQYKDAEREANKLTHSIKDRWFQNFSDKKKIEAFESSFNLQATISVTKIKNLYKEVSELFSIEIKKTLDDALKFRKELSESRRSFLLDEINGLKESIQNREKEIAQYEEQRAKYFNFLATEKAIKDLTEAFSIVSEKRQVLSDLEGNVKVYNDLITEKAEIELEIKRIETESLVFLNELGEAISEMYELFSDIYSNVYNKESVESVFEIKYLKNTDRFIDINIAVPDMFGKGKNQGRTLIYDLFVLINSFKLSNRFPKFLVHDGIFDGVDKAHFVSVYEYIQNLAQNGAEIQYITTINEEGSLSEKFGNADAVTPDKIESEAILTLSSNRKLFGKTFKNQ